MKFEVIAYNSKTGQDDKFSYDSLDSAEKCQEYLRENNVECNLYAIETIDESELFI